MSAECFKALGLSDKASEEEAKSAWRRLASVHHPDRGGEAAEFSRLRNAYNEAMVVIAAPKECPKCKGLGKVKIVNGWTSIDFFCQTCSGTGIIKETTC